MNLTSSATELLVLVLRELLLSCHNLDCMTFTSSSSHLRHGLSVFTISTVTSHHQYGFLLPASPPPYLGHPGLTVQHQRHNIAIIVSRSGINGSIIILTKQHQALVLIV